MRTPFHTYVMGALSKTVDYTAPGQLESVKIKAIVRDVDRHLRIGASSILTHNAEGTVNKSDNVRRGGIITKDGVDYVVQGIKRSPVPHIQNLALRRVGRSGTDESISDYAKLVIGALGGRDNVIVGGEQIEAQVNLSETVVDDSGLPIEDFVCVVALKVEIAETLKTNDEIFVNGELFRVQSVRRDGRGLAKVVLR